MFLPLCNLETKQVYKSGGLISEFVWNEDGTLNKKEYYDEKGKFLKRELFEKGKLVKTETKF
ncbi:MAG: hypothetical protein COA79_21730 [Planctomycetota bacterium]|nr:MAG: hypothetical protein COA79_21730 [Planctomycetota bacterium]